MLYRPCQPCQVLVVVVAVVAAVVVVVAHDDVPSVEAGPRYTLEDPEGGRHHVAAPDLLHCWE